MRLDLFKEEVKKIIKDARRMKILVLCALILLQSTVFAGAALDGMLYSGRGPGAVKPPSVVIIGGADGPTKIIVSGGNSEKPSEPQSGHAEATEDQRLEADKKGLLILINKQNPIDSNYKPDDLTKIKYYAKDRSEAGRYMRKEAADQFHLLAEAAAEEGYELVMTTAYRSYGFQQVLWNNYVANEGEAAASRFSAKPGQSEHQSGLAVDVSSPSVDYALTENFGKTEEGIWLANNAHLFGFIIRFPQDKEDITGYLYEPWHIRYVGEPIASDIFKKGLTLEEYLSR
jgi:D-alanyl-D-alanine carboxypeptidase